MYGLVDAPLLWQMSLLTFIKDELEGYLFKFDENFVVWTEGHEVKLCMVIHLDDIFVVGKPEWISWAKGLIEARFGTIKEIQLPFTYLGVAHEDSYRYGFASEKLSAKGQTYSD